MQLLRFLDADFRRQNFDLDADTFYQYRVSVNLLDRYCGEPVHVASLTDELLQGWLNHLKSAGRSARTINSKRGHIIALWKEAKRRGLVELPAPDCERVRRVKVPKRRPTAWPQEDMRNLANACLDGPCHGRWTGRNWLSLVLTAYDTIERLSALLASPLDNFDPRRCTLFVPAEIRKGKSADKLHRLHPSTVQAIEASIVPGQTMLFPWPVTRRKIWRDFKMILKSAGLPCGRRDLFHKIRRTGYTLVWVTHGPLAATEFAGHQTDLSAFYLDPTFVPRQDPLDALPRPL